MGKRVIIDIGHRGADPGAVGKLNGKPIQEAKINNNVGKFLAEDLVKQGFEVAFTTKDGETADIDKRVVEANRLAGDCLVSVHHNAGGGSGFEVIYSVRGGASKKLAEYVAEEFLKLGQTKHGLGIYCKPGIKDPKKDYYGILRGIRIPGIITEYTYVDSSDILDIDTLDEQKAEAIAISKGVCRLFGVTHKK